MPLSEKVVCVNECQKRITTGQALAASDKDETGVVALRQRRDDGQVWRGRREKLEEEREDGGEESQWSRARTMAAARQ